jgi:hypothetical protein
LAEIMDEHEQKAVELFLNQTDPTGENFFWIGLSDIAHEGKFVWMTSGIPAEYTHWLGGQPDNNFKKTEHFGQITNMYYQRKWNDCPNIVGDELWIGVGIWVDPWAEWVRERERD